MNFDNTCKTIIKIVAAKYDNHYHQEQVVSFKSSVCPRGNLRYNDTCHPCPRDFYADYEDQPTCTQCQEDNSATPSSGSTSSSDCGKHHALDSVQIDDISIKQYYTYDIVICQRRGALQAVFVK